MINETIGRKFKELIWAGAGLKRISVYLAAFVLLTVTMEAEETKNLSDFYLQQAHYYAVVKAADIADTKSKLGISTNQLAFYTELPDQLKTTTAFYWGVWPVTEVLVNFLSRGHVFSYFDHIQRDEHSLAGGPPAPQRRGLEKLIQAETASPGITPWRLGFLLHSYGDAYAHVYVESNAWRLTPYLPPHLKHFEPNPRFGQQVLYDAPIGHGLQFEEPDLVHNGIDRFEQYFTNMVLLLNRTNLSTNQQSQVNQALQSVRLALALQLSKTNDEQAIFRKLFDNVDPYDPAAKKYVGPFDRTDFALPTGLDFKPYFPSDSEVAVLLDQIEKARIDADHEKNSAVSVPLKLRRVLAKQQKEASPRSGQIAVSH